MQIINFRHVKKARLEVRNQWGQTRVATPTIETHMGNAISTERCFQAGTTTPTGNPVPVCSILELHRRRGLIDRWTAEVTFWFTKYDKETIRGPKAKELYRAYQSFVFGSRSPKARILRAA